MRVPLTWLADYVDLTVPLAELSQRLTMANLKVEAIEQIGANWDGVVVGQVLTAEPHPSSRKPLLVTQTDLGGGRVETIVTGAQNVSAGDRVPVFPVGSVVPHGPGGSPLQIEPRPMAGIISHGMLASPDELGLAGDHSGILILPSDAPVGAPLKSVLGDDVLDLETQPNRPDTLGMIGIAREVAALVGEQLSLPRADTLETDMVKADADSVPVRVETPNLCPRYTALRVQGLRPVNSPFWLCQRLEAAGLRSINLIVDLTNYVMLEYGQPLHAFDARHLSGGEIIVRPARTGETLRTLDGIERVLEPGMLVIADHDRAVGVAGVMGGENSEITSETESVILEAATFDPISVRTTARALGLRTEASARFERGLPPELPPMAARRFVQLLAQITGAPVRVSQLTDIWVGPEAPRTVQVNMGQVERLLGTTIPPDVAAEALSLQGFEVTIDGNTLSAVVPFWRRVDIAITEDLIEEIARTVGYDAIPVTLPAETVAPPAPSPDVFWGDVMRERLLGMGITETVTRRLTSARALVRLVSDEALFSTWSDLLPHAQDIDAHDALPQPVQLVNPPTADRNSMPMLLLPALLDVVSRNLKHTDEHLAFFELARTFFRRPAELPYERLSLGLALSGNRRPVTWQDTRPGPYTFYDIKGVVVSLLDALHVSGWSIEPHPHPALHPGRAAVLRLGGEDVGWLGELHPVVAERFQIETFPAQVAEIDAAALVSHAVAGRAYRPIARFPAARRDIAVIVDRATLASELERVVRAAGGQMLESARIFDVYQGPNLPAGKKSVALAMEFRAPDATLKEDEIAHLVENIIRALERELAASLRS